MCWLVEWPILLGKGYVPTATIYLLLQVHLLRFLGDIVIQLCWCVFAIGDQYHNACCKCLGFCCQLKLLLLSRKVLWHFCIFFIQVRSFLSVKVCNKIANFQDNEWVWLREGWKERKNTIAVTKKHSIAYSANAFKCVHETGVCVCLCVCVCVVFVFVEMVKRSRMHIISTFVIYAAYKKFKNPHWR